MLKFLFTRVIKWFLLYFASVLFLFFFCWTLLLIFLILRVSLKKPPTSSIELLCIPCAAQFVLRIPCGLSSPFIGDQAHDFHLADDKTGKKSCRLTLKEEPETWISHWLGGGLCWLAIAAVTWHPLNALANTYTECFVR